MHKDIIEYRNQYNGLWGIDVKIPIVDSYSLSLAYTPGVGQSCIEIKNDINNSFELTNRANSIAIIADRTFIEDKYCLIPEAENKAILYKLFAGIDAYPIIVDSDNYQKTANIIKKLTPNFSGFDINLVKNPEKLDNMFKNMELPIFYEKKFEKLYNELENQNFFENFDKNMLSPAIFKGLLEVRATNFDIKLIDEINQIFNKNLFKNNSNKINFEKASKIVFYTAKAANNLKIDKKNILPEEAMNKYLSFAYEGDLAQFENSMNNYDVNEDIKESSVNLHKMTHGVIRTTPKIKLQNLSDYEFYYSKNNVQKTINSIKNNCKKVYDLTPKGNLVAVISDGSAVLGFGNIGPEAGIPVMEGKSALLKKFAGIDSVPICLKTQDTEELIDIIGSISPMFGGINLEDISAPRCFEVEKQLIENLDIPVFHDDQHGTAIIVLAGIINALKVADKALNSVKIVVNGAGAAATAVTKILVHSGVQNIIVCDINGALYRGRTLDMDIYKEDLANKTNPDNKKGDLKDLIKDADVFIGLSVANALNPSYIKLMADKPIIFALANPVPEIMPDIAYQEGAFIVSTGRSDFKNQINNSLAFPGVFRGALDVESSCINNDMKISAAYAIANLVEKHELNKDYIIPNALDLRVSPIVAAAVAKTAIEKGFASKTYISPQDIAKRTQSYLYEGFLRNYGCK